MSFKRTREPMKPYAEAEYVEWAAANPAATPEMVWLGGKFSGRK
jgi:hypothetical protein